jgi:hypothetical protein
MTEQCHAVWTPRRAAKVAFSEQLLLGALDAAPADHQGRSTAPRTPSQRLADNASRAGVRTSRAPYLFVGIPLGRLGLTLGESPSLALAQVQHPGV